MFSYLFDLFAPPRPSERLVRELTLDDLLDIRPHESGALPYHDAAVRALVWEVKYYANQHALKLCGALLREQLIEAAHESIGAPLLVPVPMHKDRRRERGHNQTELLCEAALPGLALEYAPHILERIVHTKPQQGLPETKRRSNVKNSMRVVDEARVRGRVCLVLDDVATTGATLAEASRALRLAGAREVITLALAQS